MSVKLFSSLAIAALVVLGLGTTDSANAKVRKGDRAAEFVSVKDAAGKKVSIKSFKNQVVVLTFGASWCKPCSKELPAYEQLAKKYDKKKVIFIAINIDSKLSKGKAFMKTSGVSSMLSLYDPKSSTVETYDPPTMPSTFVIKKGIVKHVHAGFRKGDSAVLKKVIDKNL
ncbi:MAG: TlpA family protein disulfide reductase [Myxococcales bacterium]|nr:TlpA family protein disulfide reductase [Myxococcales bacterium]